MVKVIHVWDKTVALRCVSVDKKAILSLKDLQKPVIYLVVCFVLILTSFSAFEICFASGLGYQRNRVEEENLTMFV